jgi:class 3 adenylate cyclase
MSLQQLTAHSTAAATAVTGTGTVFQLNAIGSACLTAAQAVLEQGGLVNKIMMDEKGLVLIYAFGTPGCSFEDNSLRALRVGCAILTRLGPLPHSSSGGSSKRPRAYNSARRQSFSAGSSSAAGASARRGSVRASSSGSAAAVAAAAAAAAAAECTASIGVATGQVCAALLGLSTVRCEYALVGDTVNLAARLAAHAHATGHGLLACNSTMVRAILLTQYCGQRSAHYVVLLCSAACVLSAVQPSSCM